jgi:hypothetical protein
MTRQRHFSDKWYLTIIAVTLALNSAAGQQFEGTVTANGEQPLVGALVKAEAKGGIQTVVTKTDSNGYFALSDLKTDPILLSIELDGKLLFRAIVPSRPQSPLNISLPTPIRKTGSWVPVDLASGTGSTVFVLDRDNAVSKITVDSRGSRLESVFVLPQSHALSAIAASQQSVLVTGNNGADCSIFRYSIETKSLSSKTISGQGSCAGIATDGNVLYVVFTDRKEIKFWKSWDSGSYGLWRFDDMRTPGPLFLDESGHQLLLADTSTGTLYSVSVTDGKAKMVATNIGWAAALAANSKHIAIASGKKILFVSRADYRGEDPPTNLKSLTGGNIVGLAIDGKGRLWFADYDKHLVQGPVSIN